VSRMNLARRRYFLSASSFARLQKLHYTGRCGSAETAPGRPARRKAGIGDQDNDAGTAFEAGPAEDRIAIRRLSKPWIRLSSRKILLIKGRSRLAPPSRSGMERGRGAYHIVGVEEAKPERGSISWISTAGAGASLAESGDKVRFRSPTGDEELTIMTVRYSGG